MRNINIRPNLTICFLLTSIIIILYSQVVDFSFIDFDDTAYIIDNPHVISGLTIDNIIWAFGIDSETINYWHPLVWLSYMLDAEFFGVWPGQYHISNVLYHIITAILLYFLFNKMTGSVYRSGVVAALFAIHPINVESVAWVSERKNVLSTLFLMLTLLAYTSYAQKKTIFYYLITLFFFILGLMAKPMLVSLPFLLLLLDYWPLRRIDFTQINSYQYRSTIRHLMPLILEKIPFFFFSLGSIYLSSICLNQADRFISFEVRSISLRTANALLSYILYIGKLVWPSKLTFFYPYPSNIPIWQFIGSVILLIIISIYMLVRTKKYPYLAVGWLWYIIALIPVSGLIQAGLWPAMADRWTYVPFIGLFVIISWGINDLLKKYLVYWKRISLVLFFLVILLPITWLQVGKWRSDIILLEHTISVTANNHLAHGNLGGVYFKSGRIFEAVNQFSKAINIYPANEKAHSNLGASYYLIGRPIEAIEHLQVALKINPTLIAANDNLSEILQELEKMNDAVTHYNKILLNNPNDAEAHYNLGLALFRQGKINESIIHFNESTRIKPHWPSAQQALQHAEISANFKSRQKQ